MKPKSLLLLSWMVAGFILVTNGWTQDIYFGKNKVQYKDFDWSYIQTENFDIYYYKGSYRLADFAAQVLENAYPTVSRQLNYDLRKRVPIIIYNSQNDFQQTNVISELIEENVGGFTESFKNRVVVPFTGMYEDFRHVLHHELTHAVVFDMLYGNIFTSIFSRGFLLQLPLWFSEGFAEYSSRNGWDAYADMILRDATIQGYLYPLEWVGGFLAYKEGQSVLVYIAQKYGEEKIAEILSKSRLHMSLEKGLKSAIGKDLKTLNEEWMKSLRKQYWPELAIREEPNEIAKQLTFHDKDGSFYNEKPAYSPDGEKIAIFSDRSDFTEIYIISAINGKVIQRLVKGERSGDFESLHSFVSGLSWSPDGKNLAFMTKSKGKDVLCLINVNRKKIYKKKSWDLNSMYSPAWSPDGKRICFVGTKDGLTDLYLYNIEDNSLQRLTSDMAHDQDPSWSPDGNSIVFASDRPINSGFNSSDSIMQMRSHNLFIYNFTTSRIEPLTRSQDDSQMPAWSPDGKKICYVSNQNGIDNLYIYDLDSALSYPVTNILTGCFSPSWSHDGSKIAFSCFYKGGWDIYVMKDIRPKTEKDQELTLTSYFNYLKTGSSLFTPDTTLVAEEVPDTTKKEELKPEEKPDFSAYVFKATDEEEDIDTTKRGEKEKIDTSLTKLPTGEYKENKYKLKFTPDLVSGAFGYSSFFGLVGQSVLAISDIMGNHHILIATDLINTIDQSNIQIFYDYQGKRTDYGIGILHTKYFYIDQQDRLFADRLYGGLVNISRPFSKFTRIELSAIQLSIDRRYYDPPFDDRSDKVMLGNLSLINDTVLWGLTGPINGNRYLINYEHSFGLGKSKITYYSVWFDYRKYWHFAKRYNFVYRLTAGASFGKEARAFYLGGTTNWISPDLARRDIYNVENLYFAGIITPLRGYDYYEISGTKFFLLNLEFRYPFIERLTTRFPLSIALSNVSGAMFIDLGAAWTTNKYFRGMRDRRLEDLKTGFGFGARANLGFLVLRYDYAWRTDLDKISSPRYYFSLGAEF